MSYKYGDIIRLKEGVMPQMSLDKDTFFNLSDEEGVHLNGNIEGTDSGSGHYDDNDNSDCHVKTYWGLPESAFETDDMGYVYLKSEYAKRLVWGVDDVTRIHDDFGGYEYDRLNINVAFDAEGVVNCGAFCSFVNDGDICSDVDIEEHDNIKEELKEKRDCNMTETNKRVVHEEFGAGEVVDMGYFGQSLVASVRFDDHIFDGKLVLLEDLKLVLLEDLKPEINENGEVKVERQYKNKGKGKIDDNVSDAERKLAHEKKMERIQAEGIALAKEIEDMSNETLIEEFERLIRNGAGPGYREVVFMKRDMLRRMDREDHL